MADRLADDGRPPLAHACHASPWRELGFLSLQNATLFGRAVAMPMPTIDRGHSQIGICLSHLRPVVTARIKQAGSLAQARCCGVARRGRTAERRQKPPPATSAAMPVGRLTPRRRVRVTPSKPTSGPVSVDAFLPMTTLAVLITGASSRLGLAVAGDGYGVTQVIAVGRPGASRTP